MRAVPFYLVVVGLLLHASSAFAFKVPGHEAIEGLAYNRLLGSAPHAMCEDPELVVSGKEVLRFLISVGVFAAPRCFDARPDSIDARQCEKDSEPDKWPVLGAGGPDDLYARQFGGDGQCFHFMAEAADVSTGDTDPVSGVSRGQSQTAHRRCVQTLTTLWQELLAHPEGSRSVDRGMYALIHAVEDSYSAAHVERDEKWRILYLKAWDLVSFPYLLNAETAASFGTERQHQISDERDDAWRSAETSPALCPSGATPIELAQHAECFSPRGLEAASAVEDLITTTYCAFRGSRIPKLWDSRGPHGAVTPLARREWTAFLNAHFTSANPAVPIEPDELLPPQHRERTPELLIGLRARTRLDRLVGSSAGIGDAALAIDTFPVLRGTYPLVPFVGLSPGLRLVGQNDKNAGFTLDAGVLIPLSSSFAIGVSPMSFESYWSIDHPGLPDTALAATLRADVFLHDGLWLSAMAPRFEWISGHFLNDVSLAVGYAWDIGSAAAAGTPGYRDAGLDWNPRPIVPRPAPIPLVAAFGLGPQVAPASGYGVRVVMPEILATVRGCDWFEYGGAFVLQTERRDEITPIDGQPSELRKKVMTAGGIATRIRFWPGGTRIAGVGLTPIQADLGDASGFDRVFWDVQSSLQAFVRLGAVEVVVDSPPVRWHDERPDGWRPHVDFARDIFVRFGWHQSL